MIREFFYKGVIIKIWMYQNMKHLKNEHFLHPLQKHIIC